MEKSRKAKRTKSISLWQQWLIGIGFLCASLLFSFFFIIEAAERPFATAEEKALQIAKQHVDLEEEKSVEIYNGTETFYSVIGTNAAQESIAVLVPETSSDIYVYQLKNGISKKEAKQRAQEEGATTIDKIVLGYEDGQPIWEVQSGTAYYVIGFESGQLVKKEGL